MKLSEDKVPSMILLAIIPFLCMDVLDSFMINVCFTAKNIRWEQDDKNQGTMHGEKVFRYVNMSLIVSVKKTRGENISQENLFSIRRREKYCGGLLARVGGGGWFNMKITVY